MWFHWAPPAWRAGLPFEIGLYYFLTLTGFLITRILLREREAGEKSGKPWRAAALRDFLKRRFSRILVPCYVAMLFALLVGAADIRQHPLVYFTHVSNFHIAWLDQWPPGTAHYWTLAIQIQFYLLWPLVVFFTPHKWLGRVFVFCIALAPVSRFIVENGFPEIHHPGTITSSALDYFSVGALLALALKRGMNPTNRKFKPAACLSCCVYVVLYSAYESGYKIPSLCYIQQTLLSVAFAGLISFTLVGFSGIVGRLLNHPAVQHVGRLSYGLYLFHTSVPLLLGWVMPFLWFPVFSGPLLGIRLIVFAVVSWGLAWFCWRWLEGQDRLRFTRLATDARGC